MIRMVSFVKECLANILYSKLTKKMLKPVIARYNLCSNITSFIGTRPDSGKRVKKNQKIPKDINRYLRNNFIAAAKITIKNKKLNKAGSSIMLRDTG